MKKILCLLLLFCLYGCSMGLDKEQLQHSAPSSKSSSSTPLTSSSAPAVKSVSSDTISIFYASSKEDPDALKPDVTYPIKINISANEDENKIALKAMESLIEGPDTKSQKIGFYTTLPPNTKVNYIKIDSDKIVVDFNKNINSGGGSCEMTQRRSQIENTLKNLPGSKGKNIVISADGDSEKVLQP